MGERSQKSLFSIPFFFPPILIFPLVSRLSPPFSIFFSPTLLLPYFSPGKEGENTNEREPCEEGKYFIIW